MIYIGSDHAGYTLKQELVNKMEIAGLNFIDLSPIFIDGDDYPDVAKSIAERMISPKDLAIAVCGTGQGICIALNRFKNIRAVSVSDVEIVKLARKHNHANTICLAGRFLGVEASFELVKIFLNTEADFDSRHLRRLNKLS